MHWCLCCPPDMQMEGLCERMARDQKFYTICRCQFMFLYSRRINFRDRLEELCKLAVLFSLHSPRLHQDHCFASFFPLFSEIANTHKTYLGLWIDPGDAKSVARPRMHVLAFFALLPFVAEAISSYQSVTGSIHPALLALECPTNRNSSCILYSIVRRRACSSIESGHRHQSDMSGVYTSRKSYHSAK